MVKRVREGVSEEGACTITDFGERVFIVASVGSLMDQLI